MKALLSLIGAAILFTTISPIWANEDVNLEDYELTIAYHKDWNDNIIDYDEVFITVDGLKSDKHCDFSHNDADEICDIIQIIQNEKLVQQNEIIIDQNQQIIDNLQQLIDLQTTNSFDNIYGDYP